MLKYMLDTNICIFTVKNRPAYMREVFNRHHGQMCISAVSLMELIYGAEKSASPERNLAVVEGFAARLDVLPYDEIAASHTGQLRAELAKSGTPIGPYDQMIAGHARSRGL
ncbi:MAG: tRNA(fMet)-specific endonuclease VapC, partial [Allorhizobium sp.]